MNETLTAVFEKSEVGYIGYHAVRHQGDAHQNQGHQLGHALS